MQVAGKVEGFLCSLFLDLGAAKSTVSPQALSNLRSMIYIGPTSTNLLSAEGRKMAVTEGLSLK